MEKIEKREKAKDPNYFPLPTAILDTLVEQSAYGRSPDGFGGSMIMSRDFATTVGRRPISEVFEAYLRSYATAQAPQRLILTEKGRPTTVLQKALEQAVGEEHATQENLDVLTSELVTWVNKKILEADNAGGTPSTSYRVTPDGDIYFC